MAPDVCRGKARTTPADVGIDFGPRGASERDQSPSCRSRPALKGEPERAQRSLGRFGNDCDLRRFGQQIAARGGKSAKKRPITAVARKLAVRMHRLW